MLLRRKRTKKTSNRKQGGNPKKRSRSSNEYNECIICLEGIERDYNCCKTSCGHEYHVHCIVQLASLSTTLCPICRRDLSIKGDRELVDLT